MMKIILIAVYKKDYVLEGTEEIGLCSIAGLLRENKYDVEVMAARGSEFNYNVIETGKPNIVGFVLYNINKSEVYNACKEIKKRSPDTIICAGGFLPTYYPEVVLNECSEIDIIVPREGERPFLDLVKAIELNKNYFDVTGIIYKRKNDIYYKKNEKMIGNINSLPLPVRDILITNKMNVATVLGSRGCINHCAFCVTPDFWHHTCRFRDIKSIVDEIDQIAKKHGINRFNFIDASFESHNGKKRRDEEFADELLSRKLKVSYFIEVCANYHNDLNDKVIEKLKKSGLGGVFVGIETFNEQDRKLYGKKSSVEDNKKIIELMNKEGIEIMISMINFNPYSTHATLMENIEHLKHYNYSYDLSIIMHHYELYKGTLMRDRVIRDGLYTGNEAMIDIYQYKYKNKEIGYLYNTISTYLDNEKLRPLISAVHYYGHEHKNYIRYIDYFSRDRGDHPRLKEELTNHYNEVNSYLTELSTTNYNWFKEILTISEEGFDEEKVKGSCIKYLKRDEYTKIVASLNRLKNRFIHDLLKIDRRYSQLLH